MLDVSPVLHSLPQYEPLVLKHPYMHPVIELLEVPPPTPRRLSSVIHSTSSYFSSSAGSDDDDEDLSECEMDVEDDHDIQSYCSSDLDNEPQQPIHDNSSFQRCIKRILQWREGSYLSGDSNPPKPQINPRTLPITFDEPQIFKRTSSSSSSASRSSMVSTSSSLPDPSPFSIPSRRYSKSSSITSAQLDMHPCPACDAFFPTRESLRAHGLATGNEACCVAVEYAFEN